MYQVLFVDDEPWIADGLCTALDWEKEGFYILGCCYDSVEALEIIRQKKPELVIMDARMPELNGLDCIQQCMEQSAETVFIVLSGYADFAYAQQSVALHVAAYLLKPLSKTELRASVQKAFQMLEKRKMIHEILRRNTALLEGLHLDEVPKSQRAQPLEAVISYIHAHFHENIRLQDIAQQFFINPNYLSVLFKKYTGKSFQEYIYGCRMNYAASLLRTTKFSLAQIAEYTGYSDYSSFVKAFQKYYHVPPAQYRKQEESNEQTVL